MLCQQIRLNVSSPDNMRSVERTRAFCFFFAREKEKGLWKGHIVAVPPGGRFPYLFIRRSPYFSAGGKVPKVPFPGNASHDCPSPNLEVLIHDKRLASSNGRIHRKSKSFLFCELFSEKVGRRQGRRHPRQKYPYVFSRQPYATFPAKKNVY